MSNNTVDTDSVQEEHEELLQKAEGRGRRETLEMKHLSPLGLDDRGTTIWNDGGLIDAPRISLLAK